MDFRSRIFVAGHAGLIGSAVVRSLASQGFENLLTIGSRELDLRDSIAVDDYFGQKRPEYVVLAAGRVAGIQENQRRPADLIADNLAIQLNTIRAAQRHGIQRFILFGSSCMYPRICDQPMSEQSLFDGKPEMTSLAYAVSKLAGLQMCFAENQQLGRQIFIPVIPNSCYGPNDNFDPTSAHVLSALISRLDEAKRAGRDTVELWGSGAARREFVHADDVAQACLTILRRSSPVPMLPLNIGSGVDLSIKELACLIAEIVGYRGRILWDASRPDGGPRKLLDSNRMLELGWKPKVALRDGIEKTYRWFTENVTHVARGAC